MQENKQINSVVAQKKWTFFAAFGKTEEVALINSVYSTLVVL